jgi:hypothetical protein
VNRNGYKMGIERQMRKTKNKRKFQKIDIINAVKFQKEFLK